MSKNKMKIEKAIKQSREWFNFCNSSFDYAKIKPTDKNTIGAALLHLSIEHHGGISILVANKHYGSAFALLRPQFEAFVRGAWYLHCANDKQVAGYQEYEEPPRIKELIADIKNTPDCKNLGDVLEEIKKKIWDILCGYTHGGYYQVISRIPPNEYDEDAIIAVINQSCGITLCTGLAFTALISDQILKKKLVQQYDSIFDEKQA
ncbi:MAG: hypothetical protein IEMM0002_0867 [bacterium]|nr:MAG: hypothetical protein IEMM0002_0867 [bacterium]